MTAIGNFGKQFNGSLLNISDQLTALNSPPVLKVDLATQQAISNSVTTKINFDTVVFDNKSWWDPVNFAYKPQRAGYYRASWSAYGGNSPGGSGRILSELQVGGVSVSRGSDVAVGTGGASNQTVGSDLVHMNGNTDALTVAAFIVSTTAIVGFTGFPAYLTDLTVQFVGT